MAKTFILHDESLNSQGFWMLTSGADLKQFKKNPIMLWNHSRPWHDTEDQILPIGHWENIRVEGDKILADPVFDSDEFSQKIAAKVESGTIRMASLGVTPIEVSSDAKYIKPGQRYETIIKWRVKEASLVDIGSNPNALALYDKEGRPVELSDGYENGVLKELTINKNKMKEVIEFLKLSEGATAQDVIAAIRPIQEENVRLRSSFEKEQEEKKVLQDKLDAIALAEKTKQREAFDRELAECFKDGRLTEREDGSVKKGMIELFELDPEKTMLMLTSLTPRKGVGVTLGSRDVGESAWDKRKKEIDEQNK